MKMSRRNPGTAVEEAIKAARQEQRSLILGAAANPGLPSYAVIARIAGLEAQIFSFQFYQETAGKETY